MNLKRVIIYFNIFEDEIKTVEKNVSKILDTYAKNAILTLVNKRQFDFLSKQGFRIKEIELDRKISLKGVTFDISKDLEIPSLFKLSEFEENQIKRAETYWIVKLFGPTKSEWKQKIENLGAKIDEPMSNSTFLVWMSAKTKEEVQALPFVSWIRFYEPVFKLSPSLIGKNLKVELNEFEAFGRDAENLEQKLSGKYIINIKYSNDIKSFTKKIEELNGKVLSSRKNKVEVILDFSKIPELAKDPYVKWITPYFPPEFCTDIAAEITTVKPLWNIYGLDGEGEFIAVLDSGINTTHPDFPSDRIQSIHSYPIHPSWFSYPNFPELDDSWYPIDGDGNPIYDDGPGDNNPVAGGGHGTRMAGAILGTGAASQGQYRGMAYKAKLIFQAVEARFQYKDPLVATGDVNHTHDFMPAGLSSDLEPFFETAYNDGARIHNNSWGSHTNGLYPSHMEDIDKFVWDKKDMAIIFAIGNKAFDLDPTDGVSDRDTATEQSNSKNCIAVGASESYRTNMGDQLTYGERFNTKDPPKYPVNPICDDLQSDNPEGMYAFSGRGFSIDQRIKPDIVAPGSNIIAPKASSYTDTYGQLDPTNPHHLYYLYDGGTSIATAIVSGSVALIRQYLRKVIGNTNPSAALLKAILIHGANLISGQYHGVDSTGTPLPNDVVGGCPCISQGWGKINLQNSLFPQNLAKNKFIDIKSQSGLQSLEKKEFQIDIVNSTIPLKVTLVYTDYYGNQDFVNILKLHIDQPSSPGSSILERDAGNVQQSIINSPQIGNHVIRVSAEDVSFGPQDFALVISGGLSFIDCYIRDNSFDDGIRPIPNCLHTSPDIRLVGNPNDFLAERKLKVTVTVHNHGPKNGGRMVRLYWARNLWDTWHSNFITIGGANTNMDTVMVPGKVGGIAGEVTTQEFELIFPDTILPENWLSYITSPFGYLIAIVDKLNLLTKNLNRWQNKIAAKKINLTTLLS